MTEFCQNNDIDHDICGKVVVASNLSEEKVLENLAKRGHSNGLKGLKFLTKSELKKREPYVKAIKALLVPEEGIVSFKLVMKKLKNKILEMGGDVLVESEFRKLNYTKKNVIDSEKKEYQFDKLFNCTGLHTDRVFEKLTKTKSPIKIIPFRGEYFKLKNNYNTYVNHLIYPVPDQKYPFLGVHFTRMINGDKEVGPNAVLAFKERVIQIRIFHSKIFMIQ